jgi:hypothetical protein
MGIVNPCSIFPGKSYERSQDLSRIFDISSEKITQSKELTDFFDGLWGLPLTDGFEFVPARTDSILAQEESKYWLVCYQTHIFAVLLLNYVQQGKEIVR